MANCVLGCSATRPPSLNRICTWLSAPVVSRSPLSTVEPFCSGTEAFCRRALTSPMANWTVPATGATAGSAAWTASGKQPATAMARVALRKRMAVVMVCGSGAVCIRNPCAR
ncbi:hypothetical protein ASE76_07850 [Xylophilus sp. Leaf220]|nr:hypothetical protein ASE76_07850 [Xylophilus sp. Leaf220]